MNKKKIEFSKVILAAVVCCWFFGVGFGAMIVLEEKTLLGEWLAYVGAPVAVAIGFYSWKAKAENVVKLSKTQAEKVNNANL